MHCNEGYNEIEFMLESHVETKYKVQLVYEDYDEPPLMIDHLFWVELDVVLVHDVDEVLQPDLVVVVVVEKVEDAAERLVEDIMI